MATAHKVIVRALGLASAAALGALTLTGSAASAATATPTKAGLTTQELNIVKHINEARAEHGRGPLTLTSCPNYYANRLAGELAGSSVLAHQSMSHIAWACRASVASENIARGSMSSGATVDMWMHSPAHYANIIDSRLTQIGVGVAWTPRYSYTTVVDFIRR